MRTLALGLLALALILAPFALLALAAFLALSVGGAVGWISAAAVTVWALGWIRTNMERDR